MPPRIYSLRVLAVGGGAGGGSGCAGGGGSGYVRVGEFAVTPLAQIGVIVGSGGRGSTQKMDDKTQNGGNGGRSAFGNLLSADGGVTPTGYDSGGGNGGSGGGGGYWHPSPGTSGAGGTDGGNGVTGDYRGGTGRKLFATATIIQAELVLSWKRRSRQCKRYRYGWRRRRWSADEWRWAERQ